MLNIKCNACGLINFASAQACKRCETPLLEQSVTQTPQVESAQPGSQARAPKARADYSRVLLKPMLINGIGVDLRDYRQLSADTYQVTRCFTFLYIPLIPISTWVIRPLNRELSTFTTSERFNFELIEDKGLEMSAILRLYGNFLLWSALAFGPFALILMRMSAERESGERGGLIEGILFMLSMPWSFGLLIWLKRRQDRIYTLTKKSLFARLLGVR